MMEHTMIAQRMICDGLRLELPKKKMVVMYLK